MGEAKNSFICLIKKPDKKRLITKILKTNRAKLSDKMQQNMLTAKRQEVEQLRIESRVERKKVSRCLQELMDFCEANKKDDGLLVGLNNAKDNPWRAKRSLLPCAVL